jgi:alpha-N-arabinofuranosidase
VLADDDPGAANTEAQPDRVRPRSVAGTTLPPRSWNVLRLR